MVDFGQRAIHILNRPKLLCNDWLEITFSYKFDVSTSSQGITDCNNWIMSTRNIIHW